MKLFRKILALLMIGALCFCGISCKKAETTEIEPHPTITEIPAVTVVEAEQTNNKVNLDTNEDASSGTSQVTTATPEKTEENAVTEGLAETEETGVPAVTVTPEVTEENEVTDETPAITEEPEITDVPVATEAPEVTETPVVTEAPAVTETPVITEAPQKENPNEPKSLNLGSYEYTLIYWDDSWGYASYSAIHDTPVRLYRADESNRNGIVVAVNAGHGTQNGSSVKTLCHPDGSAKVTGGSTAAGETKATAVSYGTSMLDGTPEYKVNLSLAFIVRDLLLENGYDVLMIRENNETQLDNIARTVFANNNADCHIALHYDSTENDKGFFFIGVPDSATYRSMEPVASHWLSHDTLGNSLLNGIKNAGLKVYSSGRINLDLTQTSYSTVPSVDVEIGDRKSDYSESTHRKIATALVDGLNEYFDIGN